MSYQRRGEPERSDWRRYDDRRDEKPPPPRDFARDTPLEGGVERGRGGGSRRDPNHHYNDIEGLKIRISNPERHADTTKRPIFDDLPDTRKESRNLKCSQYDAPNRKETEGLKITVGNDRFTADDRRISERRHADRQHFSRSPDRKSSRSHSVRSDSVRSKSPTPSADIGLRSSFPDLDIDFKGPKIDMNSLNPMAAIQSLQADDIKGRNKQQHLEQEFYKRLSSPFLSMKPASPAGPPAGPPPATEKKAGIMSGVVEHLESIDDEDAFLYGDTSEPVSQAPKRPASPVHPGPPPSKKRGLFDEESLRTQHHHEKNSDEKIVFEYHNQSQPAQPPRKNPPPPNLYEEKESAVNAANSEKDDYDPTIENILKSIGFNFELSKQTQEKAQREREASFSLDEGSSFLEGGIDMAALFQEKLKEAEKAALSESKQGNKQTLSYEEKARRYREDLIQKAKAEMEKRKPANLFDKEQEAAGELPLSTIDLALPPISGPMKMERSHRTPRVDVGAPAEDPDAEWERRRQEFLRKLQQPRLESENVKETKEEKKRTVLPPREQKKKEIVKRLKEQKEQKNVKGIKEQKEKLARDYEEKDKRLKVLDRELARLRRQQNELMRKKQKNRSDGHRDPLLLANTQLQEDIALQIKALRLAASDKGSKPLQGDVKKSQSPKYDSVSSSENDSFPEKKAAYDSLSSSDTDDFTEKKLVQETAKGKKVFMMPKPTSPVALSPPVEKKSFVKRMAVHYEYFDAGSHWCQHCNIVSNNVSDLFEHLHSKVHRSKMDLFSRPWAVDNHKNDSAKSAGMKSIHAEIKGVEFMIPTQAFFCNVCKEFSGDSSSAEQHLKTTKHNEKYRQFVEDNQFYEKRLALARAAGMAGGKETKKVEKKKEKRKEEEKKREEKNEAREERLNMHRENVQQANRKQLRKRTFSSSEEEEVADEGDRGDGVSENASAAFIGPKENEDRSKINIKFTKSTPLAAAKKPLDFAHRNKREKILIGAKKGKQPVFFGKMRQAQKEKKDLPAKDIGMFSDPLPKVPTPSVTSLPRVLVTSQLKDALTPLLTPPTPVVPTPPTPVVPTPQPPAPLPVPPEDIPLPPGVIKLPSPPPIHRPGEDKPDVLTPKKENGEKSPVKTENVQLEEKEKENDLHEDEAADVSDECDLMDMGSDFEILDECDAD